MRTSLGSWASLPLLSWLIVCGSCRLPPPHGGAGFGANQTPPPEEARAEEEPAPAALIGKWQAGNEVLEFGEDGTLLINGTPNAYTVADGSIVVEGAAGTVAYPFELSAQSLVVTLPDGPVTYARLGAATAEVPSQPGAAEPAQAAPSGPSETPAKGAAADPAMVGKWCYVANIYANDGGGRQSETCFVLNPDGSYQYHSESSSSNPFGAAWSQADDTGTWQATATTLVAHSNSGKVLTYRLERKNHPKNNDPMLVVDGQAFVTFYQKPPW